MKSWIVILSAALVNIFVVTGQLFWKQSSKHIFGSGLQIKSILLNLLSNIHFWIGSAFYIIATLVWIYLLSKNPLSYLYAMTSIGFIYAIFVGWVFLGENISILRLIGICLIVVGIIIVSQS